MNLPFSAHLVLIVVSLVSAVAFAGRANATVIGGPIANPANGHNYLLLDAASWTASEAEAITLGGHLATINDAGEQDWVWSTFGSFGGVDRNLWIGLNDADAEGTFVWSSGEPVTYTNWGAGEPNGAFATEDYSHMQVSLGGKWNDRRNSEGTVVHSVVEVVPEPSTVLLLATGLLLLGGPRLGTS